MADCVMGIDVGAVESTGVLVELSGVLRARIRHRHRSTSPQPGWAEQDAETLWWDSFVRISRELMNSLAPGDHLIALGCSAVGPSVVPVSADLTPLRPGILYGIDTRAGHQIAEIERRLGPAEVFNRCGNALTSQSAGPKIAWIVQNEPDVAARTRWYLTAHSYLVAKLTDRVAIDHATAGFFHPCYDATVGRWNTEGIDDLIPRKALPELCWSNQLAGWVTARAARATSLPEGLAVVIGTSTTTTQAIGSGVLADGDVMVLYGATGYLAQVQVSPRTNPGLWSSPFAFPGRYLLAAGTSSAGSATQWLASLLGMAENRDGPDGALKAIIDLARGAPAGSRGVLHLPHLAGERTPFYDPHARGAFLGLSLTTDRAAFARAHLEGIAHSFALALTTLLAAGRDLPRVVAAGHGAGNDLVVQTVCTITGVPQRPVMSTGAAFGAAMLAAMGVHAISELHALGWVREGELIEPAPRESPDAATVRSAHDGFIAAYRALTRVRDSESDGGGVMVGTGR